MKEHILSYLPGDHPWQNQIYWFDSIESTNTYAKELARAGAPEGTVLIADRQTGGRGRMGRSFSSPGGAGVYMSVILRPSCEPEDMMHLTCATAVSMCDAVERTCGFRPGIKWTNDLVCQKRKLGGILTELAVTPGNTAAIVGIGINVSQAVSDFLPELQSMAGSLAMFSKDPPSRAMLAANMICSLHTMAQTLLSGKSTMLEQYRRDCVTLGADVSVLCADTVRHGHALSVDDSGALVVRFADGHTEAVTAGEVSVRGMYGYI